MAKTKSMTRNQNQDNDDASSSSSSSCSRKRSNVGFNPENGVCKSWRSYALSNKEQFMASRLPMPISINTRANKEDSICYLEDSEGRRFKTILPHSTGRTCVGLTCGYVILYGGLTRDFWLVNPITRHELHFPDYPFTVAALVEGIKAVLVFSPSISRYVFVVLLRKTSYYSTSKPTISFHIEGKRRWNHVSSRNTIPILDLHVFKGKIYTLHTNCTLSVLRLNLNQKRKWTLLETKYLPHPDLTTPLLVTSKENLFVISWRYSSPQKALKLDFGEMKWVSTIGEYAFFICGFRAPSGAAIKPESWADLQTRYKSYQCFWDGDRSQQCIYYYPRMWYFPHDCLNVSDLDD